MPTTLKYLINYPAGTAAPNVPLAMQTQAESVEAGIDLALDKYPKGLVSAKRATFNTGAITSTTIIENIASYTFKAGRKYRISFQSNFFTSDSTSTFALGISTASTADAWNATTGLSQLVSVSDRPTVGSEGRSVKVTAYYFPASDVTLQVKSWALRVVGGGSLTVTADATNPRDLLIEDLGKQF